MRCYLCKGTELKIIKRKLRYNIRRNVLECRKCGLVFLQPKKKDLKTFYDKEYRKLYSAVLGKVLTSKEMFEINMPFQPERISEIKEILRPNMRMLEIGSSTGHFLYSLRGYAKESVGIEFNEDNARFASEKLGIRTYSQPLERTDIPQNHFDLILLYFVLEHVEDPIKLLKTARKYLKDNGHICVRVPNVQDSLLSVYNAKAYSDFWFREPHIYYFSPKTLSTVMKKSGFKGSIKIVQEYNFLNQMNWLLSGKPQKSPDIGRLEPRLPVSEAAGERVKKDFNQWMRKVNKEYVELLKRHKVGDNLLFIGQP